MVAVIAVGVLHTLVPDHWAPIALLARQRAWSRGQAARAAAGAGIGHTVSTLLLALVVWIAGVVFAQRFGHVVTLVSSAALVGFGLWMMVASLREMHTHGLEHQHSSHAHAHVHRHSSGARHYHWHEHDDAQQLETEGAVHQHEHGSASYRTALLLILGSSPMVEGIPAFFAAAKYGPVQLAVMAVAFAASTIATYVALVLLSTFGLQRLTFGPIERYGEVISGAFIALIGFAFYFLG